MNHFYKIDSARGTIFSKSLQVVPTCKPWRIVSHLRQERDVRKRSFRYAQSARVTKNESVCVN